MQKSLCIFWFHLPANLTCVLGDPIFLEKKGGFPHQSLHSTVFLAQGGFLQLRLFLIWHALRAHCRTWVYPCQGDVRLCKRRYTTVNRSIAIYSTNSLTFYYSTLLQDSFRAFFSAVRAFSQKFGVTQHTAKAGEWVNFYRLPTPDSRPLQNFPNSCSRLPTPDS